MTLSLHGKIALITGASRGIGAGAALAFARTGAKVALTARNAEALEKVAEQVRAEGGDALVVPGDITDDESVAAVVRAVTEHYGALHLAFNNAGGAGDGDLRKVSVHEVPTSTFDSLVHLNLRATFLCMKYELAAMLDAGGGAIVNMSSGAGLSGSVPGMASYVSAKHGLQGLTKNAAVDYAARGIRINAVAPGPIATDMMDAAPAEYRQAAANAVPMRRIGTVDDVTGAVVWLCSEQAGFITGVTIPIDGGQLAGKA